MMFTLLSPVFLIQHVKYFFLLINVISHLLHVYVRKLKSSIFLFPSLGSSTLFLFIFSPMIHIECKKETLFQAPNVLFMKSVKSNQLSICLKISFVGFDNKSIVYEWIFKNHITKVQDTFE